MSERTRTVLIAVVTAVWAANFVAGMFIDDYKTSESINGIFMAIVGGVFALGVRERKDEPPKDEPPKPAIEKDDSPDGGAQ